MDTQRPGRSLPQAPTTRIDKSRQVGVDQLRAWADAAALGDTDAFSQLYESCRGWVMSRCRARLSVHDAEDSCAEVFTRAWRHLASGHRIEHPLAWLATVTRHLIIDHHKRTGRAIPAGDLTNDTDQMPVPDPAPGPAELAADIDVAPMVCAWLAQLPPQTHAAVTGHLSAEEQAITSARAGCSLAALRSGLFRARRVLRARLDKRDLPCPPIRG